MIAAPIGSIIFYITGDLRMPMLLMLIPQIIALIVGFTLIEPKRFDKTKETQRYLTILKEGVSFFWHHKILKILALDMVVIGVVAYFVIFLYQGLLMKYGVDIKYFGIVHFLMLGVQILVIVNIEEWKKYSELKEGL